MTFQLFSKLGGSHETHHRINLRPASSITAAGSLGEYRQLLSCSCLNDGIHSLQLHKVQETQLLGKKPLPSPSYQLAPEVRRLHDFGGNLVGNLGHGKSNRMVVGKIQVKGGDGVTT